MEDPTIGELRLRLDVIEQRDRERERLVAQLQRDLDRRDAEIARLAELVEAATAPSPSMVASPPAVTTMAGASPEAVADDPVSGTRHRRQDGASGEITVPAEPIVERRRFFGTAAALAAGGVAATVGLSQQPAAADNGQNVILGFPANTASLPTGVAVTGAPTFGFGVSDNGLPSGFANPAAIAGHAKGLGGAFATAVYGQAEGATGVYGRSDTATGVRGHSDDGLGIIADSTNHIALSVQGDVADILFTRDKAAAPPDQNSDHTAGEVGLYAGSLWFCTTSGTPGTWKKLAGPTSAGTLHILDVTTRVYDSRLAGGRYVSGEERAIWTKGILPGGAGGALLNITATNTNPGGFFGLFRLGTAWGGNASLNWALPNATVGNTTVVGLSPSGWFNTHMEGAGGADLIVDVIGYFQ